MESGDQMKFSHQKSANEREAGTRIRSGFLWIPKTLGNETRWMEHATWEEVYEANIVDQYWQETRWIGGEDADR